MTLPAAEGLNRTQRRSLALAHRVIDKIIEATPDEQARIYKQARHEICRAHRLVRGSAHTVLDQWTALLDGPFDQLADQYSRPDLGGCDLRQLNPFAGVLTITERHDTITLWRHADQQRHAD